MNSIQTLRIGKFRILLLLITLGLLLHTNPIVPLAQDPAGASPDADNPNFDFSVYFTGNVRGNIEPCG